VRVADLDIQSQAGAQSALQRIRRAATVVCGGEPDGRDLDRQAAFGACVRAAVNETVAQSHSPALAALNGTALPGPVLVAAD
jgi:UrcA family protein